MTVGDWKPFLDKLPPDMPVFFYFCGDARATEYGEGTKPRLSRIYDPREKWLPCVKVDIFPDR